MRTWWTRCRLVAALGLGLGPAVVLGNGLGLGSGTSVATAATVSSGYNNWSCVPSATHPEPVVLLHGLGATYYEDLGNEVAPYLEKQGYCVYGATYGATSIFGPYVGGVGPIPASGLQISQ